MTKLVFATAVAVCILMTVGVMAVSGWALALTGGGLALALFRRRKNVNDGEVSC